MSTEIAGTGKTVTVQLEAVETQWKIAPGRVVSGYGFNGQVPGPTIEANVAARLSGQLQLLGTADEVKQWANGQEGAAALAAAMLVAPPLNRTLVEAMRAEVQPG